MKNIPGIFLVSFLQLIMAACTDLPKIISPPGYDLAKPAIYKMPSVLKELSGIALRHGKTDTIYAEQDEEGKLFYFHLGDAQVNNTKFSKRGDYEDVAICNEQVFMLRSDGVFFSFPISSIVNKEISNPVEQAGLLPRGEYESLFADETNNALYLLCKNSSEDKAAELVSGYVFLVAPGGKLALKDHFSIDEKAIAALPGMEKTKFKPSGLAKHPITNQWYIVSSVNRALLITYAQWKPLSAYPLMPVYFSQPEGIAFDAAASMFIANEKGTVGIGSIYQFNYQKK